MKLETNLARNLQYLCARERSVSEVCRQLGFNRQQFARYLSGTARPSAHNLHRICAYFQVTEAQLDLPNPEFSRRIDNIDGRTERRAEALISAFPGNLRQVRQIKGFYHAHYISPSMPNQVLRALVQVFEADGLIQSRTAERLRHPQTGLVSGARYLGLVAQLENTIFLVERGRVATGGISETILEPAHRGTYAWMFGMTLGYSWRLRKPFTSKCVWKRLRASLSLREALSRCGAFPLNSRSLDPIVVQHFSAGSPA